MSTSFTIAIPTPRRQLPVIALLSAALLVAACSSDGDTAAESPTTTGPPATTATTTSSTTTSSTTEPPRSTTTIEIPEPVPVEPGEGWELVWQDEFEGDEINLDNWTYDIGGWGWGNGEAQYYTDRPENSRVENGLLVIEARQEQFEGSYYTSARLRTQGLQEFQYGRFEARLKVPEGAGLWPAFWMLGANFSEDAEDEANRWPNVGEIDVMEHLGREPDLILGTVHGPGYSGGGGLTRWNRQDYPIADDFHTYAVEWEADEIRWYYDGEHYFTVDRELVGDREWVFDDHAFFMIVNLAVGGQFPGPIDFDLEFPVYLYVDHVRVYQRTADATG